MLGALVSEEITSIVPVDISDGIISKRTWLLVKGSNILKPVILARSKVQSDTSINQ